MYDMFILREASSKHGGTRDACVDVVSAIRFLGLLTSSEEEEA
jgi:hypothetical protein